MSLCHRTGERDALVRRGRGAADGRGGPEMSFADIGGSFSAGGRGGLAGAGEYGGADTERGPERSFTDMGFGVVRGGGWDAGRDSCGCVRSRRAGRILALAGK